MVSSANASCHQIQTTNANTLTIGTSSMSENRSITITLLNKSYKKKELVLECGVNDDVSRVVNVMT